MGRCYKFLGLLVYLQKFLGNFWRYHIWLFLYRQGFVQGYSWMSAQLVGAVEYTDCISAEG